MASTSLLRGPMSEYKVTQRGKTCDVYQELDRLEKFGLIEKIVPRETKLVKSKNPDIKVAIMCDFWRNST
jgi:DNA-binding PadR family transcriptional regulator